MLPACLTTSTAVQEMCDMYTSHNRDKPKTLHLPCPEVIRLGPLIVCFRTLL
jgi:hypothetical protein